MTTRPKTPADHLADLRREFPLDWTDDCDGVYARIAPRWIVGIYWRHSGWDATVWIDGEVETDDDVCDGGTLTLCGESPTDAMRACLRSIAREYGPLVDLARRGGK